MIKIDILKGKAFAAMMTSGANMLYNNRASVDELNVFPVPDGDTGTNMSLTITALASEVAEKDMTLTKTADAMSFATLRGARGNSGVILSQLFRGISKSLKGKEECNAAELADALKEGADAAYKAVMKPTEGTILTVAREAAIGAQLAANAGADVLGVISGAAERGQKALNYTTQQLPALKQANVVDAGGQGWMYVLLGAEEYLKSGSVTERQDGGEIKPVIRRSQKTVRTEDIKFKYCTEFLIEKADSSKSADGFREAIADKGDCMLVIDDEDIVKVHIHTNHPGFVLEEAVKLGEMINLKIDNMKHQHRTIIQEAKNKPENKVGAAAVAEKAKKPQKQKTPKEKKPKPAAEIKDYGFIAVSAGKGLAAMLRDLGVDRIIEGGQTMNPSTDDFLKAIKRVDAKTVYLFPNNKNIVMAAKQAAELAEGKTVVVIESTSLPQCVSAMVAFNTQKDADINTSAMQKAVTKVKTGQLTYAVRDTQLDGMTIKKDDILGMIEGKIVVSGKDMDDILNKVVSEMVDEDTEYIAVYCGKDVKQPQADRMLKAFEAKYEQDEIEVSFKRGGQPLYYYIISVE